VCWGTSADPTTALATKTSDGTGTGIFTSAVTGLLPSTTYHIRAYATNTEGTSYGEDKTFTTTAFVCGTSALTANHYVANGVAPLDKSVTYGTVSTTLFGGTKCAITQNLGATNQASSATDETEASAGWYWQFNRKQGYKADCANGNTCYIPSSPVWNTLSDNLSATWEPAKDPCTLELGSEWRIPTHTEWTAADANGSWGNYTNTYNSNLKLHAAGYLVNNPGFLYYRGSNGRYWSNTQYSSTNGWTLFFDGGNSYMYDFTKASGHTIRCLRDLSPTLTTTDASVIGATTATSGGNITAQNASTVTSRGVCWSTNANPTTALSTKTSDGTGTGIFTSSITGLLPSTLYHIRAYATNTEGTSYGEDKTFTTTAFVCGTSALTANHYVANGVAPVDKSVTYGTVSTTLFGGTKCAITQNLGADHQATAVDDATEASAGWYWQFNRKQGYKLADDGTTRTPNTSWIDFIDENSDWVSTKDPCISELGIGWRIPTCTEWTNADESGSWSTLPDLWSSNLKLHAGGSLLSIDGSLNSRGITGTSWSSSQGNTTGGCGLSFTTGFSGMSVSGKVLGFSLRCIKDLSPTLTTTDASVITATTASSGGNITAQNASAVTTRGVCWSTSADPTISLSTKTSDGTGTGIFTSAITGLLPSTLYHIKAYATNTEGTSYGEDKTFTTTAFVCGTTALTANHYVANGVAPVDKLVTYGTVSTTLFGGTKCAITQNLGSDHQATAADDATEASAGWYWQFNRKQGYKHTGATSTSVLTPSWTITSISETSDWVAANDPCTLELGTGWRLPTNAEWTSADGSWANYTDTYNSVLKLHTAGYLLSDGSLNLRGSSGHYWSSTQGDASSGWNLYFYSGYSNMGNINKANGFNARCVKDLSPTLTTTDASVIGATTATSGGNITAQNASAVTARGVCWGTSANPTTSLATKTNDGTGIGTFTSAITGLLPSTLYHIRAYATNTEGTSYGEDKTFTTTAFVCGTSALTANHYVANGVAPVDKSVSYGTVSTTLFGGTKCAITRNLGATRQASSATDGTEASAGWYWQFNTKQGYKHTGIILTPSWTITSISETSDWVAANDPCTLELGTGWRLPTKVEWTSADGSWASGTDAWSSVLKLHCAGYLNSSDGSLKFRGYPASFGYYWSSTQQNASVGWNLSFYSDNSDMNYLPKAFGFSVRCLKDLSPTLSTTDASVIGATTATSGGNITAQNASAVTARGVCWSTSADPTTALATKTSDGTGTGVFTSSLTGLLPSTLYHIRAYATNTEGTSYGEDKTFTTTACFIAGTKISMADGSLKNIEEIVVGDEVSSVNTETLEIVTQTVTNTFANPPTGNLSKITFSNGQNNTNTKNHPYWVVGKGWSCIDPEAYTASKAMSTNLLAIGDQCLFIENGNLVLVSISTIEEQTELTVPTFNFKVNQTNCYFANGVLVHNKP
jgi:hypothetical protein